MIDVLLTSNAIYYAEAQSMCYAYLFQQKKQWLNTTCIFAHTHTLLSSLNSFSHNNAECRLEYNIFSSLHFSLCSCLSVWFYCVSWHLAATPVHWWLCSTANTAVTAGIRSLKMSITRGIDESHSVKKFKIVHSTGLEPDWRIQLEVSK